MIRTGFLGEGGTVDLVAPCAGSSEVTVVPGLTGGAFGAARSFPSIPQVREAALADLDGDGHLDVAVLSSGQVAVHAGTGDGGLSPAVMVVEDFAARFNSLALADLDGDGELDLLAVDQRLTKSVRLHRGSAGLRFEAAPPIDAGLEASSLEVADLQGDGFPDLCVAGLRAQGVSVVPNRGPGGWGAPVRYLVDFPVDGFRVLDFDSDRALDLLVFAGGEFLILLGKPAPAPGSRFRRGDADGDGSVDITDPIAVLLRLFQGGEPFPCEDAADGDDDGEISLTDAIVILVRLFQGGEPLPPPGPGDCGEDPTGDRLGDCKTRC